MLWLLQATLKRDFVPVEIPLLMLAEVVASCHHGMARPQVADGGDGLQIWRAVANIEY
jgi:hypothetical protein